MWVMVIYGDMVEYVEYVEYIEYIEYILDCEEASVECSL